ncbi:MAG: STAS/SEC14 domain-containing protein [Planctomycetales bacterium]|nr:STAS/SEC14 domain-containing protein [Planctomycetales bacterium]
MLTINARSETDNVIEIELSGKLTADIYEEFVPTIEQAIDQHGQIRLLVVMRDFHGWTAGALWEDVKFDVKHFRDIKRLALVGDSRWEQGMATFCRPFTTAVVKYFDKAAIDEARAWIAD